MSEANNDRDEKALDALIALSLNAASGKRREAFFRELLSKEDVELPQEYEEALKKIGATISNRLGKKVESTVSDPEIVAESLELTAMNRKGETDFADKETEEEIRKKRQELLDKLEEEKKKEEGNDSEH